MNNSINSILLQAIENDTIDLDVLLSRVTDMQREKMLKQHKFSIWQRGDGKWLTYLPDIDKENGRRQISAISQKRLEDKIVNYYKTIETTPTFQEIFDLWIKEKLETDITKRTVDKYQGDFKRFFGDSSICSTKMNEITQDLLELEIKKAIKKLQLSVKAYSGLRIIVTGILKYANKKHYTSISPSSFFDSIDISNRMFIKVRKTDTSQVYMEKDIPLIIQELKKEEGINRPIALGLLFTFRTGLRVGELIALKYEDITNNVLFVNRQHITNQSETYWKREHKDVPYTKTESGMRNIILTDKALEVIKDIREINPNGEFIFLKNNGRRILDGDYNKYLKQICEKQGILYRSMHKIRKTYGTLLLDGGVDERFVMNQMGHKNIETTHKYYHYCNKTHDIYVHQINQAIQI